MVNNRALKYTYGLIQASLDFGKSSRDYTNGVPVILARSWYTYFRTIKLSYTFDWPSTWDTSGFKFKATLSKSTKPTMIFDNQKELEKHQILTLSHHTTQKSTKSRNCKALNDLVAP